MLDHLSAAAQLLGTVLPPELLPETQAALAEWRQRRLLFAGSRTEAQPLQPTFPHTDLPPSERLTYELVGWHNFGAYLPLFANDPSPFVEPLFKQRPELEQYAVLLLTDMRYSWKRGGCDWLLRRSDRQPVGVLHLYDLSHEQISNSVSPCCVGYALAAPFRRQGYGFEAVTHLLTQAAALFGRTEVRALSAADNAASQALLRKCGFEVLEERPATRRRAAELLWRRWLTEAGS